MTSQSRRNFMFHSLLCLAAMPLGVGVLSPRAFAAQLPRLDPGHPQAKAFPGKQRRARRLVPVLGRKNLTPAVTRA